VQLQKIYAKLYICGKNNLEIIFPLMNKAQKATDEVIISKTKEEIIKEAKRIEEDLLYSSKAHFVTSSFLNLVHLAVGF
jgi:hypothetical protein